MREWAAEVVVDERLVRRLVGQFSELVVESLRPVAEGWDNSVWLVNEEWAFRFPRRAIAIPGIEREIALLPSIAPLVSLSVPEPTLVGRAADGYPWPFFGGAHLPGREASAVPDDARGRVAAELGAFLRGLHALELGPGLPVDFNRRSDMTIRVPKAREQLAALERLELWERPGVVDDLLDDAEGLPPARPTALVHGDLHFRHLLVDDDDRLTGVIDWGDVCRADPSVDLQVYWSFLPPAARLSFLGAYGTVSDEQLLRARVLAFSINAALAAYGHVEDNADVEREALDGLERAAA